MDDQTKQAFQSASDSFKQMITLSTGVLALEVTFLKDIVKDPPIIAYCVLGISWASFLFALLFGIAGLLAITGSLSKKSDLSPSSVYANNIRMPAFIQIICFASGMIFTVIFGIILLWNKSHALT